MNINTLDDLLSLAGADLKLISGMLKSTVNTVSTPANLKKGSLVFVSTKEHWMLCLAAQPAIVITAETVVPSQIPQGICVLSTPNIKKTMTVVLALFDKSPQKSFSDIHPSATISADAIIGRKVSIGAHCIIGKSVRIGDNSSIGPGVILEDFVEIGKNTTLRGHVFVGHHCLIADRCDIHAHTTIGSDGFGFYTDPQYQHFKVPQIGNVIVEDDVEIGANCCIDRATIDSTIIGQGSKLDNLCHIAHNCSLGENSLIAAGFFVAGSTQLGKRFTTGGNTVVSAQLRITDDVMLAGRSTVTNHISQAGQYGGYPLQPLKDALKTISTLGTIVEIRKKLNLVLKTISRKD